MSEPDRLRKRRCSGCGNLPPPGTVLVLRPGGRLCPRCLKVYEDDMRPDPGITMLPAGTLVREARMSATHIGGGSSVFTTLPIDYKAARQGR